MKNVQDDRGYNQEFKHTKSWCVRMERRADWIINEITINPNKTILEIGCGTGYVTNYIAHKTNMQLLGTDLCQPFIEQATEKYKANNLTFEVLDFNNPQQIKNRKFDYIIGNGILHHLYHNLNTVFKTFKQLLNENGKIIFMEPNIYNPYIAMIFNIPFLRKITHLEPDEMAFSKTFITNKLEQAQFKNIKIVYKDFLLPGVPEVLINPSIRIGNMAEKTPVKYISQSIFISASI